MFVLIGRLVLEIQNKHICQRIRFLSFSTLILFVLFPFDMEFKRVSTVFLLFWT